MPSPATPKAKKETSKKGDVGVKQHHSQFHNSTHVSGNKLFCTTCNIVIDHTRKSSVEAHMRTEKHGSNKRRLENQENQSTAKKQRTIVQSSATPSPSHVTVASQERSELCQEWIARTDHPAVRAFLQKHVVGGGAIPGARQLQACYLQREYHQRVETTKELLANKPVSIICDKMSDDLDRFVLNILAAPLEPVSTGEEKSVKRILLETTFLESTNHTTVSQAVVAAVSNYGIEFNNIISVNTDNAGYMKKAYRLQSKMYFCITNSSVARLI